MCYAGKSHTNWTKVFMLSLWAIRQRLHIDKIHKNEIQLL